MSAPSPAPRKPVRGEGVSAPPVIVGHFRVEHSLLPHLWRITSGRAQDAVLFFVMSLANRREAIVNRKGGTTNGWAFTTIAEIAKFLKQTGLCDGQDGPQRTAQRVVKDGVTRGLFEQRTAPQARREKLLTAEESQFARENPKSRAFLIRTDPAKWSEIATYEYQAAEEDPEIEAAEEAPEIEAAEDSENLSVIVPLASPAKLGGPRAKRTPVRKGVLNGVTHIQVDSDAPIPTPYRRGPTLVIQIPKAPQEKKAESRKSGNSGNSGNRGEPVKALMRASAGVDLKAYPRFVRNVRKRFLDTSDGLLAGLIEDCQEAFRKAQMPVEAVTDELLVFAVGKLSTDGQKSAAMYRWGRNRGPGTLVRCFIAWGEEYRTTGRIELDDDSDLSASGKRVMQNLRRWYGNRE